MYDAGWCMSDSDDMDVFLRADLRWSRAETFSLLQRFSFRIMDGDFGFYADEKFVDWWHQCVYDETWECTGMTYSDVNVIANEGGEESFQLFSSRVVLR